jgi:heptosyltransferase I
MKLCLLRLSALGDATHVLPLISAIQSQRPDWQISWILGPAEAKLIQGLPGVELLVYDKKTGLRGALALRRQLRAQGVDVLLQLQLALRANVLGYLIHAARRIGFDTARSKELHSLAINERIVASGKPHVLDAFLDFLPALGLIRPEQPSWPFAIAQSAQDFAKQHLPPGPRYFLVSPCSSHPLRNWLPKRYAQVINYAALTLGLTPVLIGGRSQLEQQMAAQISSACTTPPLNLTGKDTLKELLALLQRASVVLSPDSGPAHIANALGKPVVGLYAATDPARSGPYHSLALCTDHYPAAAQQFLGKAATQLRWGQKIEREGVMALIGVDEVCTLLRHALARV